MRYILLLKSTFRRLFSWQDATHPIQYIQCARSIIHSPNFTAQRRRIYGESEDGDLFTYTSGRWLYNEDLRLRERYLKLNVEELIKAAATSIGRSPEDVATFRKLAEGGFNRIFEVTTHDGSRVIARLPYPSTGPKHYAIPSEVATMTFLRSHGLPVPKIYDYSASPHNPVGSEYILMEKVQGRELSEIWLDLIPQERMKIVSQIVQMETLLFSIKLPAYGSIYHKQDLDSKTQSIDIAAKGDIGEFCIGPHAHYRWWYQERANLPIDRGPYSDCKDILRAVGRRELTWMKQCAKPRFPYEPLHRELYAYKKVSPAGHIENLSRYLHIAEYLMPQDANLNRPIIRHPDLQPNNIFVSDSMEIVGIIDWQHTSVLPLFLHAGIPNELQNYGDEESEDLVVPRLPDNFAELNPQAQDEARETYRRRQLHFFYVSYTAKLNEEHWNAMRLEHVVLRQKLFQHAGTPWEGDNVTLKADLVQAMKVWPELTSDKEGTVPSCPFTYSPKEVEECLHLDSEQKDTNTNVEIARRRIGINIEGWVPLDRYDEAKELDQKFKSEVLEAADTDLERDEIQNHWPFDDHGEDGQS